MNILLLAASLASSASAAPVSHVDKPLVSAGELSKRTVSLSLPNAKGAAVWTADAKVKCASVSSAGSVTLTWSSDVLKAPCNALFEATDPTKLDHLLVWSDGTTRTLDLAFVDTFPNGDSAWCNTQDADMPSWCEASGGSPEAIAHLNLKPDGKSPVVGDFSALSAKPPSGTLYVFDSSVMRWVAAPVATGSPGETEVRFAGAFSHFAADAAGGKLLLRWEPTSGVAQSWAPKPVAVEPPASGTPNLKDFCDIKDVVARVETTNVAVLCVDLRDPLSPQTRLVTPARKDWSPRRNGVVSRADREREPAERLAPYIRGDQPLALWLARGSEQRVHLGLSGDAGAPMGFVDAGGTAAGLSRKAAATTVAIPGAAVDQHVFLPRPEPMVLSLETEGLKLGSTTDYEKLPKQNIELVGMPRYVAALRTGVGAVWVPEEHEWGLTTAPTGEQVVTRTRTAVTDPEIVFGISLFPRGRTYWPGGQTWSRPGFYFGSSVLGPSVGSADSNLGFFRTQYFGVDLEIRRQFSIALGAARRTGDALKVGLLEGDTWYGTETDITRRATFGGLFVLVNLSPVYFRTLGAGGLSALPEGNPAVDGAQ